MERLQKYLSRAGVASRRHAEALIVDGRVKVNGQTVTTLGTRVDPAKDLVLLDGKLVSPSDERRYFLFYKPPGVVTTLSDPEGRPTITDYAREAGGRVFPVGRLDYDAEGALLLTDDGALANKLMHPSHQVPRVYLAKVKGVPDEASLQKLVGGVRLEDGMAHAVEARIFDKADRNTWIKIVVTEGRQHLVKRLCAAIGHPVVRLYRPAHASLPVKGLRPGELRALTPDEIRRVKAVADGDQQPEPPLSLPARRHGHAAPGFEPEAPEGESGAPGSRPEGAHALQAAERGRGGGWQGAGRRDERRAPREGRAFGERPARGGGAAPGGRRDRGLLRRDDASGPPRRGGMAPGGGEGRGAPVRDGRRTTGGAARSGGEGRPFAAREGRRDVGGAARGATEGRPFGAREGRRDAGGAGRIGGEGRSVAAREGRRGPGGFGRDAAAGSWRGSGPRPGRGDERPGAERGAPREPGAFGRDRRDGGPGRSERPPLGRGRPGREGGGAGGAGRSGRGEGRGDPVRRGGGRSAGSPGSGRRGSPGKPRRPW